MIAKNNKWLQKKGGPRLPISPTILHKDKTLESIIVFVSWKVRRNCANSCSNYSSKKRPEKTILLVLVVIVAYQIVKVLFTLNVLGKESKLRLVYLNFQYRKKEADKCQFCISEKCSRWHLQSLWWIQKVLRLWTQRLLSWRRTRK